MNRRVNAGSPISGLVRRPAKVLIVDDNELVTEALALLLSLDHATTSFTLPAEALAHLEAGAAYDVILCDLMMPVMNGMELYDRLHQTHPREAERIVFMTGGILLPKVRAFLDRVPNVCLEKPLDTPALLALIDRRVRPDLPAKLG